MLDEIVEFSQRADDTRRLDGRRSSRREKFSVRELLYGLMLPSGNDAAVALAEHFGSRLGKSDEWRRSDSYDCFIAAMNDKAKELDMELRTIEIPMDCRQKGHQSSAGDLLKLAIAAMKQPLFRKYVSTLQHGCTVDGPGGYKRNIVWKNTNRLLRHGRLRWH